MNVNDNLQGIKNSFNSKSSKRAAEQFLKLPKRAQELILATMSDHRTAHWYMVAFGYEEEEIEKMTPIEIIFDIAFSIYKCFAEIESVADSVTSYTPLLIQENIFIDKKKYIPDFLFNGSEYENAYNELNDKDIENIENIKIIIECDGHEFHQKTKEQVARDNEREYNLKMQGYDVIRFSGSQIYNDPLGCAEKAYKYIANRIMQQITRSENCE